MKNAKQPNADGVARPMLQTATRMMMMTFVNKVEFQGQQHHFYFPVLGSWLAKEVSRADAASIELWQRILYLCTWFDLYRSPQQYYIIDPFLGV